MNTSVHCRASGSISRRTSCSSSVTGVGGAVTAALGRPAILPIGGISAGVVLSTAEQTLFRSSGSGIHTSGASGGPSLPCAAPAQTSASAVQHKSAARDILVTGRGAALVLTTARARRRAGSSITKVSKRLSLCQRGEK
jgi:hypothetical protein